MPWSGCLYVSIRVRLRNTVGRNGELRFAETKKSDPESFDCLTDSRTVFQRYGLRRLERLLYVYNAIFFYIDLSFGRR